MMMAIQEVMCYASQLYATGNVDELMTMTMHCKYAFCIPTMCTLYKHKYEKHRERELSIPGSREIPLEVMEHRSLIEYPHNRQLTFRNDRVIQSNLFNLINSFHFSHYCVCSTGFYSYFCSTFDH
jgi:hypothetical protein